MLPADYKLYPEQEEIILSVITNPKTFVRSYHGAGKTFTAALAALTFLLLFPNCKVVTTAPGWSQVKFLLWVEINRIWNNSPLKKAFDDAGIKLASPLGTQLKINDNWFAVGLSPRIEAGEDVNKRITGFHADYFLAILDEGPAVSPPIWAAVETLLTSANSHLLSIGNPVDSSGDFYRGFHDTSNSRITLDIFRNPNFKANKIDCQEKLEAIKKFSPEKREVEFRKHKHPFPAITTPQWAVGRLIKWGAKSPLYLSRVLSQFPEKASDSLISLAALEKCKNVNIRPRKGPSVLACDPARFGDDDTAIMGFKDWKQTFREAYNGKDLVRTANRLIYLANKDNYGIIVIDVVGIGAGVVDIVRAHFKGKIRKPRVYGVGFNEVPCAAYADTCKDLVTELFKRAEELTEAGEIGLEDEGSLFAQLVNRRYEYKQGLMVMESKDDYKKRTGAGSPDEGDTLLLAIYGLTYAVMRAARVGGIGERASSRADW